MGKQVPRIHFLSLEPCRPLDFTEHCSASAIRACMCLDPLTSTCPSWGTFHILPPELSWLFSHPSLRGDAFKKGEEMGTEEEVTDLT